MPTLYGYKVSGAKILDSLSTASPGKLLHESSYYIIMSTIDYDLMVYKDVFEIIMNACTIGDMKSLVDALPFLPNIDTQNELGWSPLMVAVYNNHPDIAKYLITSGANVNMTNYSGTTVAMYTRNKYFKNGDSLPLLKELVVSGANLLCKDGSGKTLFDYAVSDNNKHFVDYLQSSMGDLCS